MRKLVSALMSLPLVLAACATDGSGEATPDDDDFGIALLQPPQRGSTQLPLNDDGRFAPLFGWLGKGRRGEQDHQRDR